MNNTALLKSIASIAVLFSLIPLSLSCTAKKASPAPQNQIVTIERGNLIISVPVDGNLVMPQAFDLRFGTSGDVKDVLVEEGDHVKTGAILARLDNTTQRLDIQSANSAVQKVLSNLYETVPRLPQFPTTVLTLAEPPKVKIDEPYIPPTVRTYFDGDTLPQPGTTTVSTTATTEEQSGPWMKIVTTTVTETTTTIAHAPWPNPPAPRTGTTVTTTVETKKTTTETAYSVGVESKVSYPFYYPNSTTLTSVTWAQYEVARARNLFQAGKYGEAESELYVAINDLESCAKIIEDTITNPQSGLGGLAPFVDQDEMSFLFYQDEPFPAIYILELRNLVEQINKGQAAMFQSRALIKQGKYQEARGLFEALPSQVEDIGKAVLNNVNLIEKRHVGTVYGQNICLHLYEAADDSLSKAFAAIEKNGIDSPEFKSNLRVAQHQMALCNAILGSNDYVLQHGLSLKAEHQYKVDLEKSLVNLGNKQDDFLKTIILAPFDGTVVSVGIKKNDVLSAQDYSSKGIQVVDTTAIKFEGLVDEIDILKVKTRQKASITVDAMPNKVFTGTASFISPYGEASTSNVVKFAVTIQLDPTDVELKGGLTATADIAIESAENVLLVPLRAITSTPQGVFVTVTDETTGQTEKRKVTLGKQNLQFAEVLLGLNEGEKVVMEIKITGAPIVQGFPSRPPSSGR